MTVIFISSLFVSILFICYSCVFFTKKVTGFDHYIVFVWFLLFAEILFKFIQR